MPSETTPAPCKYEVSVGAPDVAEMLPLPENSSKLSETAAGVFVLNGPELHTIFGPSAAPGNRAWRSHGLSAVIHGCALALILAVSVPASLAIKHGVQRVVYLAPKLEPWKPPPARIVQLTKLRPFVARPAPVPPSLKLDVPSPPVIAEVTPPRTAPPLPAPKIQVPEAPRPKVVEGVFARREEARAPVPARQVIPAGFGDPQGVRPQSQASSSVTVAKLGSFDLPNTGGGGAARPGVLGHTAFGSVDGGGTPSGSGHAGSVRAGGFGDGEGTGTFAGNGRAASVRASGFGDNTAPDRSTAQRAPAAQPAATPAEILFKPKPAYTGEARSLHIEGQVSLQVVFQADATVRILRVVRGLGHGLDEAAREAALQVRFRPATRGGIPVDVNATLYITFQLT